MFQPQTRGEIKVKIGVIKLSLTYIYLSSNSSVADPGEELGGPRPPLTFGLN